MTILIGIIFFLTCTFLSQNTSPDSFLYNFKRIYEKSTMLLKSDPRQKALYYEHLLDERMNELKHVYKYKEAHFYILSSSLRYSTTAGEATQFIIANRLTDRVNPLKNNFNVYKKEINSMIKNYSGTGNRTQFLRDANNYTDIYLNTLEDYK